MISEKRFLARRPYEAYDKSYRTRLLVYLFTRSVRDAYECRVEMTTKHVVTKAFGKPFGKSVCTDVGTGVFRRAAGKI